MILTLLIGPRFLATNQEEENKGERTLFLLSSLYQLFFFSVLLFIFILFIMDHFYKM
jgi:hypothetical protein